MKYIDLGLPSGTLWADTNEEGYYTFDEAVSKYGGNLPTYEQFKDLKDHCKWEWIDNGYTVTGPNGNVIVLPAAGYRGCNGGVSMGSCGDYWSSAPTGSCTAWYLFFNSISVCKHEDNRGYGFSIRLVKSNNKDNNMKDKELNLVEILKDCPEGTELYTPMFGKVWLIKVDAKNKVMPICVRLQNKGKRFLTSDGRYSIEPDGECLLFPSKENRDWSTFNVRQNFKKGDFVAVVNDNDEPYLLLIGDTDWSSLYSDVKYICYVDLCNGIFEFSKSTNFWCDVNTYCGQGRCRLATDDEKVRVEVSSNDTKVKFDDHYNVLILR